MCLCVSKEKEDEKEDEERSLRLSSFCIEKRERKNVQNVKLIK